MAKFNGTYSFRSGYHGVRKSASGINISSDFWTCPNGHRNSSFELVDDRAKGGFVHREKVTTCKQCAAQQSFAADLPATVCVCGASGYDPHKRWCPTNMASNH